jgi:hypothetical protein
VTGDAGISPAELAVITDMGDGTLVPLDVAASRFPAELAVDVFGAIEATAPTLPELREQVHDATGMYPTPAETQRLLRLARRHAKAVAVTIPRPMPGTGNRYMAVPLKGTTPAGRRVIRKSARARARAAATNAESTLRDLDALIAVSPSSLQLNLARKSAAFTVDMLRAVVEQLRT